MEACAVAVMARVFLHFDWVWAFMLGYVVAPISPAVVLPSVLALQDQGYGTTTGIPSMMVASAALDDVLSLAGFGIFSSLAQSPGGSKFWTIMNGPLSFVLGIVGGMVGGLLMAVLLPRGVKYNAGWRAGWLFAMAV